MGFDFDITKIISNAIKTADTTVKNAYNQGWLWYAIIGLVIFFVLVMFFN